MLCSGMMELVMVMFFKDIQKSRLPAPDVRQETDFTPVLWYTRIMFKNDVVTC